MLGQVLIVVDIEQGEGHVLIIVYGLVLEDGLNACDKPCLVNRRIEVAEVPGDLFVDPAAKLSFVTLLQVLLHVLPFHLVVALGDGVVDLFQYGAILIERNVNCRFNILRF